MSAGDWPCRITMYPLGWEYPLGAVAGVAVPDLESGVGDDRLQILPQTLWWLFGQPEPAVVGVGLRQSADVEDAAVVNATGVVMTVRCPSGR